MAIKTHLVVGSGEALPANRTGRAFSLLFTIDTATVNIGSGDIVKLLPIPAGTLVEQVIAVVRTEEGGTLTFDLGDYLIADDTAVNADGFLDGADGNSAGVYKSSTFALTEGTPNTIDPAYTTGKVYTAATAYLGVLFNNAADAAIIDIHVVGVML